MIEPTFVSRMEGKEATANAPLDSDLPSATPLPSSSLPSSSPSTLDTFHFYLQWAGVILAMVLVQVIVSLYSVVIYLFANRARRRVKKHGFGGTPCSAKR